MEVRPFLEDEVPVDGEPETSDVPVEVEVVPELATNGRDP
jgi:hypothetical protein